MRIKKGVFRLQMNAEQFFETQLNCDLQIGFLQVKQMSSLFVYIFHTRLLDKV